MNTRYLIRIQDDEKTVRWTGLARDATITTTQDDPRGTLSDTRPLFSLADRIPSHLTEITIEHRREMHLTTSGGKDEIIDTLYMDNARLISKIRQLEPLADENRRLTEQLDALRAILSGQSDEADDDCGDEGD